MCLEEGTNRHTNRCDEPLTEVVVSVSFVLSLLWTQTVPYTETEFILSRSDILEGTVTTFCGVDSLTVHTHTHTHTAVAPSGLMTAVSCSTATVLCKIFATMVKNKGKVHPCTGTEALYRPYGP